VTGTERFDPVSLPPNAIPVSGRSIVSLRANRRGAVGGHVTEYWYPVDIDDATRRASMADKERLYSPPSYQPYSDEKAASSFTSLFKRRKA
jgi:hypothetical protein